MGEGGLRIAVSLNQRCRMTLIIILVALLVPSTILAQKLPGDFTCQDLIDVADGKLSRSTDGGRAFVPIKVPRPRDAFGEALLAHETYLCRRLVGGEITVAEFDALHAEKVHQLRGEQQKILAERKQLENQQSALQNQQKALQNQERALQNQNAAIQTQREAIQVQRQTAVIQALQAEAARQQRERQQQIQQQQLEQIRQEQARPKSFSCFGGGNFIRCN